MARLTNNETQGMWKEVVVVKFETEPQHLRGETEESHRILVSIIGALIEIRN
jgi:hypothetical protein